MQGAHPDPAQTAQPAVLELGDGVGAAVIYMPARLNGAEIEIKPRSGSWDGAHTAIRARPTGLDSMPLYAALFYGLQAGTYDLRLRGSLRSIQVQSGRVTEQTW